MDQPPGGGLARFLTAIDLGQEVPSAECPSCVTRGGVRINPFVWEGKRHLHWLCQSCRHVWVEPERRQGERISQR
jgi:hypothetical protein